MSEIGYVDTVGIFAWKFDGKLAIAKSGCRMKCITNLSFEIFFSKLNLQAENNTLHSR